MFTRNCPKCGQELEYKSNESLRHAINKNNICRKCAEDNRRRKITEGLKLAYKENRRKREVSDKVREKISNTLLGNIPWNKGLTKDFDERLNYGRTKKYIKYKCKSIGCNNYLECTPSHVGNRTYCDKCKEYFREKRNIGLEKSKKHKEHIDYLGSLNIIKVGSRFMRKCSECGKELFYGQKSSCLDAERNDRVCMSCVKKGHMPWNVGLTKDDDIRLKHTNNSIKKIRLSVIKNINERIGQFFPNYNPSSILILEEKAKELGITDLQHAENGGEFYIKELGYWVDGYSPIKNVVIEYYEKEHKHKKERDRRRKREIIDCLGCDFIEIKET